MIISNVSFNATVCPKNKCAAKGSYKKQIIWYNYLISNPNQISVTWEMSENTRKNVFISGKRLTSIKLTGWLKLRLWGRSKAI